MKNKITTEHLKEYLRVYHKNQSPDNYLFSTTIKGHTDRMSVANVQRVIKKYSAIVRDSGIDLPKSVHCHMFRRTRATNLYQDGVAIKSFKLLDDPVSILGIIFGNKCFDAGRIKDGHIRFCRVNRLTDRLGNINKVIENKLEVI